MQACTICGRKHILKCVWNDILFPEDPKEFLLAYLDQLEDCKDRGAQGPCLFNTSNLDAVFGILDPTNEGFVSYEQYKKGALRLNIFILFLFILYLTRRSPIEVLTSLLQGRPGATDICIQIDVIV